MPRLRQFDVTSATQLSNREIRRRWALFHETIHRSQGVWWRRVIGRMLGVETRRYRAARLVGRPLLRLARSLTGRVKVDVPAEVSAVVKVAPATGFPLNYHPEPLSALGFALSGEETFPDVLTLLVDGSTGSAPDLDALNARLRDTDATWLFVCDERTNAFQRAGALLSLLPGTNDDVDVVFADEDGANPAKPILKPPSVGAHTLLSYNVVGRPALIRRALLDQVGGFDPAAGWAFEHDAYLRLHESGGRFHHVARVLPAGRPPEDFSSERLDEPTRRVVRSAMLRRGIGDDVRVRDTPGVVDWRPPVPVPAPSIDIVIPSRDRVELLRRCVEAIESTSTYPNYDIILLDNDSIEAPTLDYFASSTYRVVSCPGPFNYAAIVNRGVAHSTADYVVTLNNDTVVITPDWLERMVALAALDDVSFVGGCLLDRDGTREHESIVITPYPQHLRSDSNYPHADQFVAATRDVAAVTGAVQMVRRATWNELGGMDEELKVVMNDVDICLRSHDDHRSVVYSPDVRLYHHVGSSRGDLDPLDDRNHFVRRWDIFGSFRDPYFPESLVLLGEIMYYRHREVPEDPGARQALL